MYEGTDFPEFVVALYSKCTRALTSQNFCVKKKKALGTAYLSVRATQRLRCLARPRSRVIQVRIFFIFIFSSVSHRNVYFYFLVFSHDYYISIIIMAALARSTALRCYPGIFVIIYLIIIVIVILCDGGLCGLF